MYVGMYVLCMYVGMHVYETRLVCLGEHVSCYVPSALVCAHFARAGIPPEYVRMYVGMYVVCMYVGMHVCVHVCKCVCMCAYERTCVPSSRLHARALSL